MPKPEVELCRGRYQSAGEARAQLARMIQSYPTRELWQARAERVRTGILRGAGLAPWPERTPLAAVTGQRRRHAGYSVENVAFESLPDVFVTGSLYRPDDIGAPLPAVLVFHPHVTNPRENGRFAPAIQALCAALARTGAIALACDMVGHGELAAAGWRHTAPNVLGVQLWNSVRMVDLLIQLPEVNPALIAATGASGGGTQTILLAAIDQRVAVAAPVVQVSAHFFGGCVCESGMPIHKSADHATNNAEIAALAAPRPQLLVSDGQDWTKYTPKVEFPYLRHVYGLYGAESQVENLHLADEGHDFGPSKRQGVYRFLASRLGLAGAADESGIVIEDEATMHCFGPARPLPARAESAQRRLAWPPGEQATQS